jgi:hypothetical protein
MNVIDISSAIKANSDQFNGDDFLDSPQSFKISNVTFDNSREQKVWIFFEGETKKSYRASKTYLRVMEAIWNTRNAALWIGHELTLYRDPDIYFGKDKTGGIAISHMDGIDRPTAVSVIKTRGKKRTIIIKPFISKDAPKIDVEAINTAAREAAAKGKASFTDWWKANASTRDLVKPIMDELKAAVAKADAPAPAPEPADAPTEGNDNDPAI